MVVSFLGHATLNCLKKMCLMGWLMEVALATPKLRAWGALGICNMGGGWEVEGRKARYDEQNIQQGEVLIMPCLCGGQAGEGCKHMAKEVGACLCLGLAKGWASQQRVLCHPHHF